MGENKFKIKLLQIENGTQHSRMMAGGLIKLRSSGTEEPEPETLYNSNNILG